MDIDDESNHTGKNKRLLLEHGQHNGRDGSTFVHTENTIIYKTSERSNNCGTRGCIGKVFIRRCVSDRLIERPLDTPAALHTAISTADADVWRWVCRFATRCGFCGNKHLVYECNVELDRTK